MGEWVLTPLPLVAATLALVLYGRGFARLRRRRPDLAPPTLAGCYVSGVVVATLAVVSPIDPLGEQKLLTAHMAQHLLLGDIAPLLIVLGLRGPMCFFLWPPEALRFAGRSRPLRRTLTFLFSPGVSLSAWIAIVYVWHVPAIYDAAIAHPLLHDSEHAMFFLAGLLVWTQIIDPAGHERLGAGKRAVFALAVLAAGSPLAELLIVARPMYPHYIAVAHRPLGFTAASDQDRAGLLMMAEQIATLASAAALLLWSHLERLDRLRTGVGVTESRYEPLLPSGPE